MGVTHAAVLGARVLLTLPVLMLAGSPPMAAELEVQAPASDFGYTIGDQVRQRIFSTDAGAQSDLHSAQPLPELGRVTPWLQRIAIETVDHVDGRRGLELVYQVVNVPANVSRIEVPGVVIALPSGEQRDIEPSSIVIGPMLPAVGTAAPRPDRQPPAPALHRLERLRNVAIGVLGGCVLGALIWWALRSSRDAARLPFARAWQTVRRSNSDDSDAWASLHRALNATAGSTVHTDNLDALLTGRAWLAPHRAELVSFFAASDQRFFDPATEAGRFDLSGLTRMLMRAERAAAR